MTTEVRSILEQLVEASTNANDTHSPHYVFLDQGQYWICGKLPEGIESFYVAYPDGIFDQSAQAQEIPPQDFEEFLKETGLALPKKPKPIKRTEIFKKIMIYAKKLFLGYCVFAPFISLALLCTFFRSDELPRAALMIILPCAPTSFLFILLALQKAKSERIAILTTSLASTAHLGIYFGAWAWRLLENPSRFVSSHSLAITFGMVAALLMSGAALVLTFDNDQKETIDTLT